jgi:hypothetical protein
MVSFLSYGKKGLVILLGLEARPPEQPPRHSNQHAPLGADEPPGGQDLELTPVVSAGTGSGKDAA